MHTHMHILTPDRVSVRRAGGSWHTTYAPVPHYITSEMRSVFLEGYEYAAFDLRKADRVQIQVPPTPTFGWQSTFLAGTSRVILYFLLYQLAVCSLQFAVQI